MDDRSALFQNLKTKTLLVPTHSSLECYECLTLSTYKYQHYLTQKKSYSYEILVTKKEKPEIENKIPLYNAIIHARDLINQPPSLKYPELIVEHVKNHNWKHFDLHIFDHKELKKLGCNLLLAV